MLISVRNSPYLFARHPSGRVVQVSGNSGDLGRIANIVVPDEQAIQRLKPVVRYLQKMQPRHWHDNRGIVYISDARKSPNPAQNLQFDWANELPLFKHLK
jgi:hypothetical protein